MPVYKQPNSKNWLIEFKVDVICPHERYHFLS